MSDRREQVPSPCNRVCRTDRTGQLCVSCLRTVEEIAAWSEMSDDEKRAVWDRIRERRARSGGR